MANILIIDDDKQVCRMLDQVIGGMGHAAQSSYTIHQGYELAVSGDYDVVFLDVNLPDGVGLDVLPKIRSLDPAPEVIIITGEGGPDGAETAIQNGAWDYIQKPISPKKIILPLKRILQYREELEKVEKKSVALKLDGFVGTGPRMTPFLDSVAQAANSSANVLILGETGTGKEMCAKTIHINSDRADQNFVVVDCAALHSTLVESTLFGFEKGAFTGADHAREGLIKQADKGTLFLDEIGELNLEHQKSFLRVLQEKRFRAIGSKKEETSDFRLLAATNRDLDEMAKQGKFRKDLLFRLRSVTISIPPLREHSDDIKALTTYYMNKIYNKLGTDMKGYSPEFLEALNTYRWPGNIRELINTLESVISAAQFEATLFPKHLPEYVRIELARGKVSQNEALAVKQPEEDTGLQQPAIPAYKVYKERILSDADTKYFRNLMASVKGSVKDACRISGLGRTRLYTLLKKYDISRFGW